MSNFLSLAQRALHLSAASFAFQTMAEHVISECHLLHSQYFSFFFPLDEEVSKREIPTLTGTCLVAEPPKSPAGGPGDS